MSAGSSPRTIRQKVQSALDDGGNFLHLAKGTVALLLGEDALAEAERLRGDLEELVIREELDRVVERQRADPVELRRDIAVAAPHVREGLLLADVDLGVAPPALWVPRGASVGQHTRAGRLAVKTADKDNCRKI